MATMPSPAPDTAPIASPPVPVVHALDWHQARHPKAPTAAVEAADGERRAYGEHAWKCKPGPVPAADDHKTLCAHDNLFSHCFGCMRAAGLSEKDQRARFEAANVEIHGGEARDARPSGTGQSFTPIDPREAAQALIASRVRARAK